MPARKERLIIKDKIIRRQIKARFTAWKPGMISIISFLALTLVLGQQLLNIIDKNNNPFLNKTYTDKNNDFEKTNGKTISADKTNEKIPLPIPGSKKPKKHYSTREVERAAEFASQKTGVRKDFLMGVLSVETRLGQNIGKCSYQEVEAGAEHQYRRKILSQTAWNTFQKRRDLFKEIAIPLGYDYHELKVSCNPGNYVGTGGAMGIEQFMPDTWMNYRDQVAAIVDKNNPDPWDAKDGAVAMALKLADVSGVRDHNISSEKNAAKIYLSGTTLPRYDWYANQSIYWAQNYHTLIAQAEAADPGNNA